MRKIKYTINGVGFSTQKDVQSAAKSILYSGNIGSLLSGYDHDFMVSFFETFHNDWKRKVGCGLFAIKRIVEPNYGKYRGFKIVRTDGSETDISYIIGNIVKNEKSDRNDFKKALRQTIVPQMMRYKMSRFHTAPDRIVFCEITKVPLKYEEAHTDHHNPTFDEIAEAFILELGLKDFSGMVVDGKDNHTTYELVSDDVAKAFYIYHKERATYRILSASANLSDAKLERKQK